MEVGEIGGCDWTVRRWRMGIKFENVWMCMEDGNEGCLRLEDGTGLCEERLWE
jgi:hypothetical protein